MIRRVDLDASRERLTLASLNRITRDNLVEHYKKYYVPSGSLGGMVADIPPRDAAAKVEKATARSGLLLLKQASGMMRFLRVVDMGIRLPGPERSSGRNSTGCPNL